MRIVAFSQWYPPEPGGGPARFSEMSQTWTALGHDVRIVAGLPNWPTGRVHPYYAGRRWVREVLDGTAVTRTWVWALPNEGAWKRAANHVSFLASAPVGALTSGPRPDVVVATSPPLFAAVAGWAAAKAWRVPFVMDVRDLWPDAIFALGLVGRPGVRRALEAVERRLYRDASAVVAVAPRFGPVIEGRGAARVEVIPNGADLESFSPGGGERERFGFPDDAFVVLYAGTVGASQGLDMVLDAARLLAGSRAHFVVAGEGANRRALQQRAAGLANVTFLPLQPRDRMPALYRSADVCLVSLRDVELFDGFIPSKLFEIMACGRPVLASVRGTALEVVRSAGCGFEVEQGSGASLAQAVRTAMSAGALETMGKGGRRHAEEHYDRRLLARRYLDVLSSVSGS